MSRERWRLKGPRSARDSRSWRSQRKVDLELSERAKLHQPLYPRLRLLRLRVSILEVTLSTFNTINMTTYIPSLTLPSAIFENAALSVLFPIVAGTAVGFSTQRKDMETSV
jgi:hypothetical protein